MHTRQRHAKKPDSITKQFRPHLWTWQSLLVALGFFLNGAAIAQPPSYFTLGTNALTVAPGAGTNSVILGELPFPGSWNASANASWLHLVPGNQFGSAYVVFTCDANPGPTRVGTLSIAGQTVTITQAGSTYVATSANALIASGLADPQAVAVDPIGNIYIADGTAGSVLEWSPSTLSLTTLVSSNEYYPTGVAVDAAGNVYWANFNNGSTSPSAVFEWTAASNTVTELVSSGLNDPHGIALDGGGNVYIADSGDNALKEWEKPVNTLTTLDSTGLNLPTRVAVDAAINVYIADYNNNDITEYRPSFNFGMIPVSLSGLHSPSGIAVDGSGNLYISDLGDNTIREWSVGAGTLTTLPFTLPVNSPVGLAVDGLGNVYVPNDGNGTVTVLENAFVDPTPRLESAGAGMDSLPAILPAAQNLQGAFAPQSDAPWLTIQSITNGIISFSFNATSTFRVGHIIVLGQSVPIYQGQPTGTLGATSLVVGPNAGSNSVVLGLVPNSTPWANTANAYWLHLARSSQTGSGSANIIFSYDANLGPTRIGTLTIAAEAVTITQVGTTYVSAGTNISVVSGLGNGPYPLAVDGQGDVYIGGGQNHTVYEWLPADNTMTTIVSSNIYNPVSVAVDSVGNVYWLNYSSFEQNATYSVYERNAANSSVIELVSQGLNEPNGLAVDLAGDLFIADTYNNAIKKLAVGSSNLITLVSTGLNLPGGVGVDAAGNVYMTGFKTPGGVGEWIAASNSVVPVGSFTLVDPDELAVDGSGNLYAADMATKVVQKWTRTSNSVTTLISYGPSTPFGVAVDRNGNIFASSTNVTELPYVFVNTNPILESLDGGSDSLAPVLPNSQNLTGPFAPTTTASWLSTSGVTNGVASFTFATGTSERVAYITEYNAAVPIVQGGPAFSLGTNELSEGPGAGNDSIVLAASPSFLSPALSPWTNSVNANWLHLSALNQSGSGSTNIIFAYDANPGSTRTGTLSIAGQTLTITQAGATYVSVGASAAIASGFADAEDVAVDKNGTVYIAGGANEAVWKWSLSNGLSRWQASTSYAPVGVTVDAEGDVYWASVNTGSTASAIFEWIAASNTVIQLPSTAFANPSSVALDSAGNIYVADTGHKAIKEMLAGTANVVTLVSNGLNFPKRIALDAEGNVYISDYNNNVIKEWLAANNSVITLVSSGLSEPDGVAVDGSGNVYISDSNNNAIKKWTATSGTVTALAITSTVNKPTDLTFDGLGNLYIPNHGGTIVELENAFVDPSTRYESGGGGEDLLPSVVPATASLLPPFAPTSDQSWLTIAGVSDDAVNFSFSASSGPNRAAHISLLGQSISIIQGTNAILPVTLQNVQMLTNRNVQFSFTNDPYASFTVLTSTNLSLPLTNSPVAGPATNVASGTFQFAVPPSTNDTQRFYLIRSP